MHNIPFGVFFEGGRERCCSRIGNFVIDLAFLFEMKLIQLESGENPFLGKLNKFIDLGKESRISIRKQL